ncbi:MAG: polyprenol monophosphomannose synthase [Chloroflexi bacterium]|nr:MAG: polyprenol monophosphomannose synthase [Chloroflexota bacterium]
MQKSAAVVCLPTYNEAENIGPVIDRLLEALPSLDVLVVDDGSPDGTGDLVAERAASDPRLGLIRRSGRQGLGTAYLAGFRQALEGGYVHFLTMDCDLSHAPERVPALIAAAAGGLDLVIGSRYVAGGAIEGWGPHRRVLSFGANSFARAWLRIESHDCTSGFRCYSRRAAELLVNSPVRASGYSTLVELLVRCQRAGLAVGEVPITFVDRVHGKSKMSSREMLEGVRSVVTLGSALAREPRLPASIGEEGRAGAGAIR